MIFMTDSHAPPPAHILADGKRLPVATLIARNDSVRLADLGIYPHITAEGSAPLGYTDWVLIDGAYHREPAGTPEEREAAIDAQQASEREAYLDQLECTRLQGKLALIQAGLWEHYETLIASLLPTMSPAQRVFVEDAPVWKFRDPVLQMFAAELELTEQQVVELIELARTL